MAGETTINEESSNSLEARSRRVGSVFLASCEPSWATLGPSWTIDKPFLARLGPSRGHDATILSHLEPSWAILESILGHLRHQLGPSGAMLGHLESSWAPSWPILSQFFCIFGGEKKTKKKHNNKCPAVPRIEPIQNDEVAFFNIFRGEQKTLKQVIKNLFFWRGPDVPHVPQVVQKPIQNQHCLLFSICGELKKTANLPTTNFFLEGSRSAQNGTKTNTK